MDKYKDDDVDEIVVFKTLNEVIESLYFIDSNTTKETNGEIDKVIRMLEKYREDTYVKDIIWDSVKISEVE